MNAFERFEGFVGHCLAISNITEVVDTEGEYGLIPMHYREGQNVH